LFFFFLPLLLAGLKIESFPLPISYPPTPRSNLYRPLPFPVPSKRLQLRILSGDRVRTARVGFLLKEGRVPLGFLPSRLQPSATRSSYEVAMIQAEPSDLLPYAPHTAMSTHSELPSRPRTCRNVDSSTVFPLVKLVTTLIPSGSSERPFRPVSSFFKGFINPPYGSPFPQSNLGRGDPLTLFLYTPWGTENNVVPFISFLLAVDPPRLIRLCFP